MEAEPPITISDPISSFLKALAIFFAALFVIAILVKGWPATLFLLASGGLLLWAWLCGPSAWTDAVREVAWSMVIGFSLLTIATAVVDPHGQVSPRLGNGVTSLDFKILRLKRDLTEFSERWWYVGPPVLIASVLASRLLHLENLPQRILQARKLLKVALGALGIVTSFSLFATRPFLGAAASYAEYNVKTQFHFSRNQQVDAIKEAVAERVSAELLGHVSSSQVQIIVELVRQVFAIPDLTDAARVDLAREFLVPPSFPRDEGPAKDYTTDDFALAEARLVAGADAEALLNEQGAAIEAARARAAAAKREREVLIEAISAPLGKGNDVAREALGSLLSNLFTVPDTLFGAVARELANIGGETAFNEACKPIVEKLAAKLAAYLPEYNAPNPKVLRADTLLTLRVLAYDRPRQLLDAARKKLAQAEKYAAYIGNPSIPATMRTNLIPMMEAEERGALELSRKADALWHTFGPAASRQVSSPAQAKPDKVPSSPQRDIAGLLKTFEDSYGRTDIRLSAAVSLAHSDAATAEIREHLTREK